MTNIKRKYIIMGSAAAVVLILIIAVFSNYNSVRNEGIDRETALTAQYKDNQNRLSAFVSGFYETLGVADKKSDKINAILTDAVKGRYDGDSSAQPGGGQLFSAITEAYPDLGSNMEAYDKVIDYVSAGREAYKQDQSKLLDMLRAYDRWRLSGLINSKMVSAAGFPSSLLEANTANVRTSGADARARMYDIVLVEDATTAYEEGSMEPLIMPGE